MRFEITEEQQRAQDRYSNKMAKLHEQFKKDSNEALIYSHKNYDFNSMEAQTIRWILKGRGIKL